MPLRLQQFAAKTLTNCNRRGNRHGKQQHIATAHALGLKKINDVTVQPDNAATRGKLAQIGYLLEIVEEA